LIVDPVNVEAQDGEDGEGVNIQPDNLNEPHALNKQNSETDGDDDDIQDGGITSETDS
jgi:hypothetical protein